MKCKQLTIKHHSYVRFYYLFYCYVVLYMYCSYYLRL